MELLKYIKNSSSALIVCHIRPDGDTLGSGFAIWRLFNAMGKKADIVSDSDNPPYYSFLPNFQMLNVQAQKKYDLVIVCDCAEAKRMGKFADYAYSVLSINIDHHKTNDYFCKVNYVIGELSSTCELVYDIFKSEKVFETFDSEVLKDIAYCLFVGLSTDTGHFMHSSVTPKTLAIAAELAALGLNVNEIATHLYRSNTKKRQNLVAHTINSMRFFENDEICIMTITLNDLKKFDCTASDLEGLIDLGLNLKGTMVAVLLNEQSEEVYKVSFRSKKMDVSAVAAQFNGGGHTKAAGGLIKGYYEDVVDAIVKAIRDFS